MDLFNEVRFDFSGARQLSAELDKASRASAAVRTNLAAAGVTGGGGAGRGTPKAGTGGGGGVPGLPVAQSGGPRSQPPAIPWVRIHAPIPLPVRIVGTVPGAGARSPTPPKDKDQPYNGFALAATGAAAAAFATKAVSLASPSTMMKLDRAIEDTTAVIGRELIPVFEKLAGVVRAFGDFLARNPTAAKGIAYGSLGLAAAGLGLGALSFGRMALGTASWAARGLGIGGGAVRGAQAVNAGGAVSRGISGVSTGADIAEAGAAAGSASRGAGLLGKAGRLAGRASPWLAVLDPILTTHELATSSNLYQTEKSEFASRSITGTAGPVGGLLRSGLSLTSYIFGEKTMNQAGATASRWLSHLNPFSDTSEEAARKKADPTSDNAAARPTSYTDVLGAVMSLRQGFTSLGKYDDKGNEIQSMGQAADQLKEAADALKDAAGNGSGRTARGG